MKIHIDEDRCVGGGQCVLAAPEVFDQRDDDGIVVLLQEQPADDLDHQVREAALLCPALAITLEETAP
ncbi:ferredoxin [Nocardioides sp. MAH-18]|uniref:Ferredoxin n=1 Tax=Nocardioides agri TaxID=2682843 RepID=A0A6L6XNC4_9ACTN|nr:MULTISPECIES: ferredoxin [unclassified Nocardioides]MBA2953217.1 ferredoxin [Nocardioides sp. CGMCC 1.13656]MVQ48086.1 ferredoxin [Nocardioides sp. MAH-18]